MYCRQREGRGECESAGERCRQVARESENERLGKQQESEIGRQAVCERKI